MDNWFSVLKEQRIIADTGITFTLPEEEEEENGKDCCEEAKIAYKIAYVKIGTWDKNQWGDGFNRFLEKYGITESSSRLEIFDALVEHNVFTDSVDTSLCEDFKEMLKGVMKYAEWKPEIVRILNDWEVCDNE